ncbi:DUF1841 family protein [Parvibium lacunae]|uniref:DUF1841 family protein n=1 Tax=Parvibium lacunae TaxID=1888893 RepID=A0A368L3Y3_9BURK|nr:DUF1841 family protein [Parvibium lacunae]RCS58288.1 DUF1841 family protein [Parvibium lacunae]
MFNPSRTQVRQFFMACWAKRHSPKSMTPLEKMGFAAVLWHPEYHAILADSDQLGQDYADGEYHTNPFLHLSMHLAVSEQLSIDQPPGIVPIYQGLTRKFDSEHQAAHAVMDCLAEIVWQAQQQGQMPDSQAYLQRLQQQL